MSGRASSLIMGLSLAALSGFSTAHAQDTFTTGETHFQRSFVDSGGTVEQETLFGSNAYLHGSVNFIEARTDELVLAQPKNLPGPEGQFFFPKTPTGIVVTTDTDTNLFLNWRSQNGGVLYTFPADKFQVRYSSLAALSSSNFESATVYPSLIEGGLPVNQYQAAPVELTTLQYDTTYYIGVVGFDDDYARTQSLLVSGSKCTLGPTPSVTAATADFDLLTVTADVNLFNTRSGHSITWQARIADDTSFTVNVTTNAPKSTTNPTDSDVFTGRTAGKTYYVQARTINQAGVASPWSAYRASIFPTGIPAMTAIPAGDIFISSITSRWDNTGVPPGTRIQAQADATESDMPAGNPPGTYDFNSGSTNPPARRAPVFVNYTFNSLVPNTTYFFQVEALHPLTANHLGWAPYVSAMTGIPNPTVTVSDIQIANITYQIQESGVPNTHSYRVQLSTTSNFSSGVATQTVANFGAAEEVKLVTLGNLTGNTTYYGRITAINHVGWQSPSPFPIPNAITRPAPVPAVNVATLAPSDAESKVKFSWSLGNNTQANTRFKVTLSSASNFSLNPEVVNVGPSVFEHQFDANAGLPLISNNTYYGKVEVIDADAGRASLSAAVNASTVTKPIPPQSPAFVQITSGSVHIQWSGDSAVLPGGRNAADTLYTAWIGTPGTPFVRSFGPLPFFDANFIHANIPVANNVLPNTTYQFTLIAEGVGGWADESVVQTTVTLARAPTLVNLDAIDSTNTVAVTVFPYSPPNPAGSQYTYECSTDGFSSILDFVTTTDTEATFSGLPANGDFDFRARITDHAGRVTGNSAEISGRTFSNPPTLAPIDLVDLTTGSVRLNWSHNGNTPANTSYRVLVDSVQVQIVGGTTFLHTFPNQPTVIPNSTHSFRVEALPIVPRQSPPSSIQSTCTLANVPPAPLPGKTYRSDRVQFNIVNSSNPVYTEFAFFLRPTTAPVPSFYFADPFPFPSDPTIQKMAWATEVTPVWHTLAEWGRFIAGTTFTFTADALPQDGNTRELVMFARNQYGIVTAAGDPIVVSLQSGYPEVSMTIPGLGVIVATESYATPIYTNQIVLEPRALGSGHFNAYATEDSPISKAVAETPAPGPTYYQNWPGWNGDIQPATFFASNAGPVPLYGGAWVNFDFQSEGLWYFNITGDLSTDLGNPFTSTSPFRVHIDTTPVDPGLVHAEFGTDSTGTPDHTEIPPGLPTGHLKPEFFWTKIDTAGKTNPRSPIVGWTWSFSDVATDVPSFSTSTQFLPASDFVAVTSPSYRVNIALMPGYDSIFESTYYFKVRALDLAGNWTPAPSEFLYYFVKDSTPPVLNAFDFPGVEVWRNARFEAINSTMPLRINFSERMNFIGGDQALRVLQTHDRLGNPTGTTIPYNVTWEAALDGSSVAVITPNLPGSVWPTGSRFLLDIDGFFARDLAGNRLNVDYNLLFHTAMDPLLDNIGRSDDNTAWVVLEPGSFGADPAGLAIADAPQVRSVSFAPGLSGVVAKAMETIVRTKGGSFRPVLSVKEFHMYDLARQSMSPSFNGRVRLNFRYNDADDDGIVDETAARNPVRAKDLAIHWLDDRTGAWIKMPESEVDTAAKTVSVPLQHFSVYALIGAPSLDLSNAHPFPVPYKASRDPAGITFTGLSSVATVKIFTMDGRLVRTLTDDSGAGFVRWDPVTNDSGDPVGSDVYLYVIENDQQRRVGKLMVIR